MCIVTVERFLVEQPCDNSEYSVKTELQDKTADSAQSRNRSNNAGSGHRLERLALRKSASDGWGEYAHVTT